LLKLLLLSIKTLELLIIKINKNMPELAFEPTPQQEPNQPLGADIK